jgi:hypothetical protein
MELASLHVLGVSCVFEGGRGHGDESVHCMQLMRVEPYVVHQTFQYGGTKGKRHRLREAHLWKDAPEYYSAAPLLHAELASLPAPDAFDSLSDWEQSLFHLRNMEFQLLQVLPCALPCMHRAASRRHACMRIVQVCTHVCAALTLEAPCMHAHHASVRSHAYCAHLAHHASPRADA